MTALPNIWIEKVSNVLRKQGNVNYKELENLLNDSKNRDIKSALSRSQYFSLLDSLYQLILGKYPLLEQIWIEYADFSFREKNSKEANKIYELAFSYLPRSLSLWMNWCQFQLETQYNDDNMVKCLERARIAIGDHYLSWPFYEAYLNYLHDLETRNIKVEALESTMDSPTSPTGYHKLLRFVIQIPFYDYLKPHELNFKLLEASTPASIRNFINAYDLMEYHSCTYLDLLKDQTKFKAVKASLKKRFTELYIVVQYAAWRRYPYEKGLTTKVYDPNLELTRLELNKWREYLEYSEVMGLKIGSKESEVMIMKNNRDWTDVLYNRCISIAGNYHYFWMKWANYHLNLNDSSRAKDILAKALICVNCGSIFTPESLKIRLRLIDLHILDKDIEKALALCLDIVGNLNENSNNKCIIKIWVKVLTIVQLGDKEAQKDLMSIVTKLVPLCSDDDLKLKLFRELLEFGEISNDDIMRLIKSQDIKGTCLSYLERESNLLTNNKLDAELKPIQRGWICEFF